MTGAHMEEVSQQQLHLLRGHDAHSMDAARTSVLDMHAACQGHAECVAWRSHTAPSAPSVCMQQMAAQVKQITVQDPDTRDSPCIFPVATVEELHSHVTRVFRQPGFLSVFTESGGRKVIEVITPSFPFKDLPNKLLWTHRQQGMCACGWDTTEIPTQGWGGGAASVASGHHGARCQRISFPEDVRNLDQVA